MLACEFGYRACERGQNLQAALKALSETLDGAEMP
jgi:hypothetical protein